MSIKIIGHRGIPSIAPENTLLGFKTAVDIGCSAIELDVRKCADVNHLAVIHDATVERTTDGKGIVSKMNFDSLQKLDAGSGESIPDLIEVLDFLNNNTQLFIEIKTPIISNDVARLISQQVNRKKWSYENLVVISFHIDALEAIRKVDDNIHIGITVDKNNETKNIIHLIANLQPNYINVQIDIISTSLVDYAHSEGVKINVWTVNNSDDIAKSIKFDVDGIMTDNPLIVMKELKICSK